MTGAILAKIASRKALLDEIAYEYAKLRPLIERVSSADLRSSRVNSGGWSLKDVLAHVADWAHRCADWCEAGLRGENPDVPAPGLKWSEFPKLNEQIFKRHRNRPAARVLGEFSDGHARLLKLAETIDEPSLCKPRRFAWTGPTWAVANHIRANTASHYRWACKHFRRWLSAQAKHGKREANGAASRKSGKRAAKPPGRAKR